ncbi:MAG: hypothetical protein LBO81_05740 [Clostridiales Family XIII bacterium]|jgi:hypothetical protein|nr:hypothetical protein [Clostridiales Family XIII bacterium]
MVNAIGSVIGAASPERLSAGSPGASRAAAETLLQTMPADSVSLSKAAWELRLIGALTRVKGRPVVDLQAVNNVLTITGEAFYRTKLAGKLNHLWRSGPMPYEEIREELGLGSLEPETLAAYEKADRFLIALTKGRGQTLIAQFTAEERLEYFGKLGIKADAWVTIDNASGKSGRFFLAKDGTPWSEDQIESARNAWNNIDNRQWHGLTEDSVLIVNGKEYKMDENGRFNIPKGEPVIYSAGYVVFPEEMGGYASDGVLPGSRDR